MTRRKRKPFSSWRGQLFIIPVSRSSARPIELGPELIFPAQQLIQVRPRIPSRPGVDLSLDAGELPLDTREPERLRASVQAEQPRFPPGGDPGQQLLLLIG